MLFEITIFIFFSIIISSLYSYELKAVKFEGTCQLWFNNDQGWNSQRIQLFFFYDPAPFLIARNWQTQRKFVFIHPENKQLFQLSQESINRAKRRCNLEESAMEMPLANQTIYSTNVYYGNGWRRWDSYYRTNRQQETFDENDFGQNTGVARFLNPNGTSDGQFYQVWRDKAQRGQCKASLVFERQNDLDNARRNWNQLAFSANQLRSMRTYPLYNCLIGSNSCRSYHVFLVNEDDMTVSEVNIVEQNNYETRWDMIHSNQLGRFWTNGSFFTEARKTDGEYADHCSYAEDFVSLTKQSLGKNVDLIKTPPETEDEMEEEEENGTNDSSDNDENANSKRGSRNGNAIVPRNDGSRNNRRGNEEQSNPTTNNSNNNNGRRQQIENGKNGQNKNRNNRAKNNSNSVAKKSSSSESEELEEQQNGGNENIGNEKEIISGEMVENDNEENDNQQNDDGENGKIEVNSGNKINISAAGGGKGKFNFDENNSISISGTNWKKGGRRPNISMNRQTNIKMKRRK